MNEDGGKTEKRPGTKKAVTIAAIIAGCVLFLLIVAFVVIGFTAKGIKTVYPNVEIAGTEVGEMTYEEAHTALVENGYADGAYAATVELFGDVSLTVTGEDAGVRLTDEEAAEYAVNYGKDGSFFENTFKYIGCLLKGASLTPGGSAEYIDETYLHQVVSEAVTAANNEMTGNSYVLGENTLIVFKGASEALIDEQEVYDIIVRLLLTGEDAKERYVLEDSKTSNVDIQAIYDAIYQEAVSAEYDMDTGTVTESVRGISFDVAAAQKLLDAAKTGDAVEIPLVITEPNVSKEELDAVLFRDCLSEMSTSIAGSSDGRITNIRLSAEAVNGTVLNPGDEFSFNDVVGERTTEKGYQGAGAYAGGKSVVEVGGGICQVSSTIYYCVLYSNLNVVERYNHMFTVGYLPLGLDATVSWGGPEFRFSNNTEYPIRIEAYVSDGYLTVRFYGTKTDDSYVEIESVTVDVCDYQEVQKEDATLAAGETKVDTSGHTGYTVDTYKYVYDGDGTLLEKEYVDRSVYDKQDRVILVSPADKAEATQKVPVAGVADTGMSAVPASE